MTLAQDAQALRRQLAQWANDPEWALLVRYELLPQKPDPAGHQRLIQRVGRWLRVLGLSRGRYRRQQWHCGLKHGASSPQARPLLIWAEGAQRERVREACAGLQRLLSERPDLLPVLVTDVADFAFYSRLGWLVEYLPELGGEGASYCDRKRRYLAWRYRDALHMPLSAGMASQAEWEDLMEMGGH
jgi:hypothetical protein